MLCVYRFTRFRSYRYVVRIARALLLSLFFSQVALAASGCLMPSSELTQVLSQAKHTCCDESGVNSNLCIAHCTANSQTHDQYSFTVQAVPPATGRFMVVPAIDRPTIVATPQSVLPCAATPPIPILFCSFLI